MSRTLTVRGAVDAPDTRVLLTSQGSVAAPSLVVPSGMKKISKLMACAATDGGADDGSGVFFVRLGGAAVLGGEQVICFGSVGNQTVQSGADAAPNVMPPFVLDDLDIAVSPSDTISISAEYGGVDTGDGEVMVTVVFSK